MTDLQAPDFATLSRPHQVWWGAAYAFRGARIVATNPAMWGYVLAPILLMATAFLFGAGFSVWAIGFVIGLLWAPAPDAATWVVVTYSLAILGLRIGMVAALFVTLYLLTGLVATPFNDRLSDLVERRLLPGARLVTSGQFLTDLMWSIAHSTLSLTVYLLLMSVLMLVGLLPGIGSLVTLILGPLVSAAFFSREAMDGSLSRRRVGYVDKWRVVADHWGLALGFGLVVSAAMWVPLLNFLVLPMSVAGGTALFCHLERAGRIRPLPR